MSGTPSSGWERETASLGVPASFLPLKQLGPFVLLELLGEGGMGRVYRAEDPELLRDVAVKVMRPELADQHDARERFLREARAAAALQHDHIVPIFQVGEDHGTPFFAMPLLEGESLADRLQREPALPIAEVVRIGREAAEGLAAAHAKGLIHRDVKPSNLWLEAPSGRVKLLDFGLVRWAGDGTAITQAGVIMGSPGYMSPEQVNGHPADQRTDLFSLGCVLYRMAAGAAPFQRDDPLAVLQATLTQEPVPAHDRQPQVPTRLSALVSHLLSKQPADRPASAAAVVEALRDLGASPRPAAPLRRRGPLIAAAVALVAIVAGGVAAWRVGRKAGTDGNGAPPPPAPLSATLDVGVWKKLDGRRLALEDAEALPLRPGYWMRIEATANRPAYLYVVYLDAEGKAWPMFPWRKEKWDDRPPEKPRPRLNLPEDVGKAAPLEPGPSGIETVLLLARDEPLSAHENEQLRQALKGPAKQGEFDPLRGAIWLGDEEERFSWPRDRSRPQLDKAGVVTDPVERLRRLLRTDVAELAPVRRGVCYPFVGK